MSRRTGPFVTRFPYLRQHHLMRAIVNAFGEIDKPGREELLLNDVAFSELRAIVQKHWCIVSGEDVSQFPWGDWAIKSLYVAYRKESDKDGIRNELFNETA